MATALSIDLDVPPQVVNIMMMRIIQNFLLDLFLQKSRRQVQQQIKIVSYENRQGNKKYF